MFHWQFFTLQTLLLHVQELFKVFTVDSWKIAIIHLLSKDGILVYMDIYINFFGHSRGSPCNSLPYSLVTIFTAFFLSFLLPIIFYVGGKGKFRSPVICWTNAVASNAKLFLTFHFILGRLIIFFFNALFYIGFGYFPSKVCIEGSYR